MPHRLVHLARIAEPHFHLARVHVDIHAPRVDFQEQHVDRLARAVQHVFEGAAHAVRHAAVAHGAAVDIRVLLVGARAGGIGPAHAAVHAQRPGAACQRQRVGHEGRAHHVSHARGGIGCRTPLRHQAAFVPHRKADVGPRQRMPAHRIDAVRQLGGVGLQELAPRRRGEKQFARLDAGAAGARQRLHFAAARIQPRGMRIAVGAAGQAQLRYRRDGRQRLAAKPHRCYAFQLGQACDLAGGMAAQRQRHFCARNAMPVVVDRDLAHAAGRQAHGDLRGTCVERIVDQLLHDRRGPLDHFTSCDLADQLVGQLLDRTHAEEDLGYFRAGRARGPARPAPAATRRAARPRRCARCRPVPASSARSRC